MQYNRKGRMIKLFAINTLIGNSCNRAGRRMKKTLEEEGDWDGLHLIISKFKAQTLVEFNLNINIDQIDNHFNLELLLAVL